MTNSADSDQLASLEANWSESTLFAKAGHIRVQQDKGQPVLMKRPKKKKKKKEEKEKRCLLSIKLNIENIAIRNNCHRDNTGFIICNENLF